MSGSIDVRKAGERFHTVLDWLDSWHSFSFSGHYDPANTHHGLLLVNNDDRVAPASGFPDHPHRDMEIITWVLDGELQHRDDTGGEGVIAPGLAQRMRAGTGIVHSEMNPSATSPVHLVQMWVPPGRRGLQPEYEQLDVNDALGGGRLLPVAAGPGGAPDAVLAIDTPATTFWVGRLRAGDRVQVPDAPFAHVFVALGSADLQGAGHLGAGDAARLTAAGNVELTAGDGGAEVLIWEMPDSL